MRRRGGEEWIFYVDLVMVDGTKYTVRTTAIDQANALRKTAINAISNKLYEIKHMKVQPNPIPKNEARRKKFLKENKVNQPTIEINLST